MPRKTRRNTDPGGLRKLLTGTKVEATFTDTISSEDLDGLQLSFLLTLQTERRKPPSKPAWLDIAYLLFCHEYSALRAVQKGRAYLHACVDPLVQHRFR